MSSCNDTSAVRTVDALFKQNGLKFSGTLSGWTRFTCYVHKMTLKLNVTMEQYYVQENGITVIACIAEYDRRVSQSVTTPS